MSECFGNVFNTFYNNSREIFTLDIGFIRKFQLALGLFFYPF